MIALNHDRNHQLPATQRRPGTTAGHTVLPAPGEDGSIQPGKRVVSLVAYVLSAILWLGVAGHVAGIV